MGDTSNLHLPFPESNEPADVPTDIAQLANAVENALLAIKAASPPIGSIVMWSSDTPPLNWLLCQGQTNLSGTDYPALAAVIGVISGGFLNIPDLRGRVPVGVDGSAGRLVASADTLGAVGGEERHLLTAAETAMKAHSHPISKTRYLATIAGEPVGHMHAGTPGWLAEASGPNTGVASPSPVTDATVAANGQVHNNMQPYKVLNFVIRAL